MRRMRPIIWFLCGAVAAVALGVALPRAARALATKSGNSELAAAVNPTPAAPTTGAPAKVVMSGGGSAGTSPGLGLCLRISCTVPGAYRVGPSAGIGSATTDDNQLPAATPERLCLSPAQDTINFFTASAGACYVGITGS